MLASRRRLSILILTLVGLTAAIPVSFAADNIWTNAATNFTWDTSSGNWTSPAIWNNANGDGAVFGSTGVGAVNIPGGITANSINFSANGYTLNGAGPITLTSAGSSTLTTGVINVAFGTTQIDVPINASTTAFQAVSLSNAGVLALSAPVTVTGSEPITFGGPLTTSLGANIIVGPNGTASTVSTLRLLNASVLPATASVALGGGGILDIGANTVTIGALVFVNQNSGFAYGNNYGVVGAGTLKVAGEINVVGDLSSNNTGNAIDSKFDLGGGTQVIRVAAGSAFAGPSALLVTGVVSNGSLLKTIGYNTNGALVATVDGIGLFGNNTYTGSTIINGGSSGGGNLTAGTNASTSLKVVNGILSVIGANGSYGAATSIQVFSGGTLTLDNNAAFGTGINAGAGPPVLAANNGDRIPDTAVVTLRDGGITYRGLSAAASSETYGSMSITGGNNTITIAPTGTGGTATFAAAGSLTMDPRSTLQISATSAILATTGFVKFGGGVPTAVGGIIPRIVSTSDFVTYDPTNGFTPLPAGSYATSYTAGANVSLGSAASTNTVAINAVKTTASLITTINSGQVLTVSSGMMFAASGTHTISGGTLDFGATPGVFFGSHTINSAITGSQGLLATGSGTVSLAGDLSGLTGTVSNIGSGTLTLAATMTGLTSALELRRGVLNINTSLGAGGAITMGVSANDSNLLPANPNLNISGAGANATIARDIIVDNGATNAGGVALNRGTLLPILSLLSNTTGSQTLSGNITLNTNLSTSASIGTTSTGATNFTGNISGPGTLLINAGRVNLNGNYSNAGGAIVFATGGGNTAIVNFNGTATGNAPIYICTGSTSLTGIGYSSQSNIGAGPITVDAAGFSALPTIRVLATSSINNSVNMPARVNAGTFVGGVNVDVAPAANGMWTGPVTGAGSLTKLDTGTLTLTSSGNSYAGNTTISAGTLALSGSGNFASSPAVTVGTAAGSSAVLDVSGLTGGSNFSPQLGGAFALASGQTLKGFGQVSGKTVVSTGSTIAPGTSIGTLTFSNSMLVDGTYMADTAATGTQLSDQIVLSFGNVTIDPSATLLLPATDTFDNATTLTLMSVTGGGTLSGTFGTVTGLPADYMVEYTSTSLSLVPVPEPGTLALAGLAATAGLAAWRRKRRGDKN